MDDGKRPKSTPLSARACVHCQKRKTRCSGGHISGRPCTYCIKAGKACSFEGPPDRTPLTRKNLDDSERRCSELRLLLRRLNPDLDIGAALAEVHGVAAGVSHRRERVEEGDHGMQEEYEWHELVPSPSSEPASNGTSKDGMAILSTIDSGFLGRAEIAEKEGMPTRATWRILYYMALAIGYWVSTTSASHGQCPYYSAARSRISMQILEAGTMETVQGLLLMGNYVQKRDRPNTGYNLIGIAHRMALALGLHREIPGSEDKIVYKRRRQVFWVVYCFDGGFGITTGRPTTVVDGFIDTRIPRNIEDQNCTSSSFVPPPVRYPGSYSPLIAQATLSRIGSGVYHVLISAKASNKKIEYQIADSMAEGLASWSRSLPSYFTSSDVLTWFLGPRSIVLWKEQNLRLWLWRETQKHHRYMPSKIDAESRCLEAALETIHHISSFCRAFEDMIHFNINWYATYFLFHATLVLEVGCLRDGTNGQSGGDTARHWQKSVVMARSCLELLAKKNHSAHRCLAVLENIQNHLKNREDATTRQVRIPSGSNRPHETNYTPREEEMTEPSPTFLHDNGTFTGQPGDLLDYDAVTDPILRMMMGQSSLNFGNSQLDLFRDAPLDWAFDDNSAATHSILE